MYVAEEMGRSSVGVELNPAFCGLIADNMVKQTDARSAGSGTTVVV